ncbi:MAG: hypothetical protein ACHQX4_02705 [Gemmatimonadales bacterium]
MSNLARSTQTRRLARLALIAGCAVAQLQCGESGRYGVTSSGAPPSPGNPAAPTASGVATVTFISPAKVPGNTPINVGDSVLVQFRASSAKKIVSVDLIGVARRGDVNLGTDTVIPRFFEKLVPIALKTDTIMKRYLYAIPGDSTAETVYLIALATDSAGNTGVDTTTVHVAPGPHIVITKPVSPSTTSSGKSITVEIHATAALGVRILGYRMTGVYTHSDSTIYTAPLPDTTIFSKVVTIPAATASGALVINAFAVDSAGNPSGFAAADTVMVQSAASDVTPPVISFTVASRVEADDSVTIHATDPSGVKNIGFFVQQLGAATVVSADSAVSGGSLTDVTVTLALRLDTVSTFPRLLTIGAFAVDSIGNRGYSSFTGTPDTAKSLAALDTLTIVAGKTFALPAGGQIGDAIFDGNPGRNELYLTNLLLNRVEVFQVNTSTFVAGGIPVGAAPLGIALWPRDTLGNYADTVIVANSGGTNLSIVDVANRVERRRHRLPNYDVEKVSIQLVDSATGAVEFKVSQFDYSDRPQFVAATCRVNCTKVYAVYSTTPTQAQAQPGRGYLAWEEVTAAAGAPNGHFFWEIGQIPGGTDTIQVIAVRDTAPGVFRRDTLLGGAVGITADFDQIVVQDTTFVRNSGDFNHSIMGEGGNVGFARAFLFDVRPGTFNVVGTGCDPLIYVDALLVKYLSCTGLQDAGVSGGIFVRDYQINRAAKVNAVATNFNGRTNFVRADSVYVSDFLLRLQGLMQVGGQNAGMDVNPNNKFDAATRGSNGFGGNMSPNDRLVYTARPDANIEVFDSYWFASVAVIPIRDPIIGPVRLAKNSAGQQVLVGVTQFGVVVVPLVTPIANPLPIRARVTRGGAN